MGADPTIGTEFHRLADTNRPDYQLIQLSGSTGQLLECSFAPSFLRHSQASLWRKITRSYLGHDLHYRQANRLSDNTPVCTIRASCRTSRGRVPGWQRARTPGLQDGNLPRCPGTLRALRTSARGFTVSTQYQPRSNGLPRVSRTPRLGVMIDLATTRSGAPNCAAQGPQQMSTRCN